ncbi:hypothetical protein LTR53_009725 [Teratosphaeriaceae sp. CCFEE 6253]|nr:hypothetical protein LTR53_009725 [Teratosphaeriaceae sp. CCFEE 6253]
MSEENWLLQVFQCADTSIHKPSEVMTFVDHIIAGCSHAQDPSTLLVFSGGRTTASTRSEADGYLAVLETLIKCGRVPHPGLKHSGEHRATDSYQNLLFSIMRFRDMVGWYPDSVTVITHAFKERRFLELHAPAIKWPSSRIRVQGMNPPFTLSELDQTQRLEYERAYKLFEADPYGDRAPLSEKRVARNWDPELADAGGNEEPVKRLLAWEGGSSLGPFAMAVCSSSTAI